MSAGHYGGAKRANKNEPMPNGLTGTPNGLTGTPFIGQLGHIHVEAMSDDMTDELRTPSATRSTPTSAREWIGPRGLSTPPPRRAVCVPEWVCAGVRARASLGEGCRETAGPSWVDETMPLIQTPLKPPPDHWTDRLSQHHTPPPCPPPTPQPPCPQQHTQSTNTSQ